jgi:hypothetical protein
MTLPAIPHHHTLRVTGAASPGPHIETSVNQPQDEEEASDAAENNANDGASRRTAVNRAVGGRNDGRI